MESRLRDHVIQGHHCLAGLLAGDDIPGTVGWGLVVVHVVCGIDGMRLDERCK